MKAVIKSPWFPAGCVAALSAAGFVLAGAVFFLTPFLDSFKFLLYMAVFVLPGIAMVKALKIGGDPLISSVYAVSLSFGLVFALYMLFSLLNLNGCLFLIPPLMLASGAAGLRLFRKSPFADNAGPGGLAVAGALAALALGAVLLSLTGANLTPELTGPRQYHVDLLNSAGLVDSALRGFPFPDVKAVRLPYAYHALCSSFLAVMKSVTGFSNVELISKYSLTVFTPYAALALMALLRRVARSGTFMLPLFAALFILCPYDNSFLYYLYQDTLGFSLSIGLGAASTLFFIEASADHSKALSKNYLLSCLTLALSAAAKGPVAAVYLAGFGFSMLIKLIKKRRAAAVLTRGVVMLGVFAAVYVALYGASAGLVKWYPGRFVRDTGLYAIISNAVSKGAVPLTITASLLITYCFMTLGFLLSAALIFAGFRKGAAFSPAPPGSESAVSGAPADDAAATFAEFIAGVSLSGMLLMHLSHQYGGSEIYFGLAGYPFAVIGIFAALKAFSSSRKRKRAAVFIPALLLLAAAAAVSVVPSYDFFTLRVADAARYAPGSPGRIDDDYKLNAVDHRRFDLITEYEYEALLWLKDYTRKDAVIASDRVLEHNKYMYGTAFSERVFFLEGYVYITSYDEESPYYGEIIKRIAITEALYNADPIALSEIKAYGVGYVMQSKWQNPALRLGEEIVFENRDVLIYRLH